MNTLRPDIFTYFDYRAFLKDWLSFLKAKKRVLASTIAHRANLSGGYLPMVLAGKRELTLDSAVKLTPHLELAKTEQSYLENLIRLSLLEPGPERTDAVRKLSQYSSFRKEHSKDAIFFQYVSNWYHLAIREMATLPGFRADPPLIRSRLRAKVSLREIKNALTFLEEQGFLVKNPDGTHSASNETIHSKGLLYWSALSQFHKNMFDQATRAIENTPPKERNIQGYTLAMGARRFERARDILNKALDDIEKLSADGETEIDSIYQVEIALFPLTYRQSGGKHE